MDGIDPSAPFPVQLSFPVGGTTDALTHTHTLASSASASTSSLDPNSPALFKRNMEMVQRELVAVQGLAQEVLSGISGAYSAGMEPVNTKRLISDLKSSIDHLTALLRSTGVGALPLLPPPPPPSSAFSDLSQHPQQHQAHEAIGIGSAGVGGVVGVGGGAGGVGGGGGVPTEEELLGYANESVKALYDALKRKQESASVVANLLQQHGR